MKNYTGMRYGQRNVVMVDALPLESAAELLDLGTDSFDWGNSGDGAAHLAVSLLADALQSDHLAKAFADDFRLQVIARMDYPTWSMTVGSIWRWVINECDERYQLTAQQPPSYIIV